MAEICPMDKARKLKLTTLVSSPKIQFRFMKESKNNKVQNNVQNQQVNNNGCQHVQLGGMAYYDDKQYFLFSPDSVNQGVVEAFSPSWRGSANARRNI